MQRCVSQDKVGGTGDERNDKSVDVQAGGSAGELGGGGLGSTASGLDDSSAVAGGVGASDGGSGVGGRRDGAGLVGDRVRGGALHGDSVDTVDSRGDVDGSVVGLRLSSEDAGDEREEEDNDSLEGAHFD
jgi:hypothetical protein